MPAVLLDESRNRSRRGRIPEGPRRFAGAGFERRNFAIDGANRERRCMKISAVLLAGGESRRMGQDKATVLFRRKPLWQVQLDLLRALRPREIFVSARTDPSWRPSDCEFVADMAPSRGPLGGIAATLPRITTSHLFTLAIDMPFMTADYVSSLCGKIAPGIGAMPVIHGRAEPLAAVYPQEAAVDLAHALSGDDFSLQMVARRLMASGKLLQSSVAAEDEPLFRSLNEPADLLVH
jgi:molybdopterin-guanine dinucleotide biosynthesis protein A